MKSSRRGSIRRADDIIQKESTGWDGMVDVVMKYAKKIGSKRSSLAWFGASLCGFLGLSAACGGETQPLNSVPADAGGAGGSAGVGGAGGSSGSGTVGVVTSSDGSSTSGSGGSSNAGGTGGGPSSGGGSGGEGTRLSVRADKLDILFVVDNSINMAHKQPYFASAAAELVDRLADPNCVDGDDPALALGCPEGQHREFAPVLDMHVGVISTSLGGQGGDFCSTAAANWNSTQNDAGKLMPSVRDGLASYRDRGFLAWDGLEADAEAEHDLEALKTSVVEHIQSVGEMGCGYEAPLEAMYRFLIDPSPPQEIVVIDQIAQPATDEAGNVLIDTELLEQRADFLRPDSALAIVLLSDEDDCSIQGSGIGYLTASAAFNERAFIMPPATEECEADPNDPCCRSCGLVDETAACRPQAEDPNCQQARAPAADALNLRCFDQKRRFGMDLLYPVDRYVSGLTDIEIEDSWRCTDEACPTVRNPLFPREDSELAFTRRASEVFVVSVVGVPWQDLATSESLSGDQLTYKSSYDADDWSLMVGRPSEHVPPEDPLMVASTDPRSGTHPITGEAVAPVDSTDPTENSINGHEFNNLNDDSLQYSCIFPLVEPLDCSGSEHEICECGTLDLAENRPVCHPPEGGSTSAAQYFAGATPGLRQLELISQLPHGVPASICPKVVEGDADASSYGYNPAMRALLRELGSVLE